MSARTVPLHLRLSEEEHAALQTRARTERRPLASLLAMILGDAARAWQLDRDVAKMIEDGRELRSTAAQPAHDDEIEELTREPDLARSSTGMAARSWARVRQEHES